MIKNKGFTLIELLVVILIIGILAAVALPQYQLARDKSEFANFQIIGKSLADAYSRYYLIKNEYPSDIEDLDIDLAEGYEKNNYTYGSGYNNSCAIYNDFYCCISQKVPNVRWYPDRVVCSRKDNAFQYQFIHIVSDQKPSITCVSPKNTARGKRLCENISKNKIFSEDVNFISFTRIESGATNVYKI